MAGDKLIAYMLIERHLFWDRRIMRRHLMEEMGVSASTAARMLRAYRSAYPENMVLKKGQAGYWMASDRFRPHHYDPDVRDSGLPIEHVDKHADYETTRKRLMEAVAIARSIGGPVSVTYRKNGGALHIDELIPVRWLIADGVVVGAKFKRGDSGEIVDIDVAGVVSVS